MSNSKNFGWKLSKYIFNKNFNFNRQNIINVCGEKNIVDAYKNDEEKNRMFAWNYQ